MVQRPAQGGRSPASNGPGIAPNESHKAWKAAHFSTRPLDPVYAVMFIDAIQVKIRAGRAANRLVYLAR